MRNMQTKGLLTALTALLLTAVIALGGFSAAAAVEQGNVLKGLEGYKAAFEASFALPEDDESKLYPDVWGLYVLARTDKMDDGAYSFMVPAADPNAAGSGIASSMATEVLGAALKGGDFTQGENSALAKALAALQQDGAFGESSYDNIWAVIALEVANAAGAGAGYDKAAAGGVIASFQQEDGGFNDFGEGGEVDSTGMAMIALALTDQSAALEKAVSFMEQSMQEDGNLVGNGEWSSANSCSQAYGIMGLVAAGESMSAKRWSAEVDALLAYQDAAGCFWYDAASQNGDEGAFYTAPDSISTIQGLMALSDIAAGNSLWLDMAGYYDKEPVPESTAAEPETTEPVLEQPSSQQAETEPSAQDSSNPKTGDEGVSWIVWVLIGAAVVAIVFAVAAPAIWKRKNSPQNGGQNGEGTQDPGDGE